MQTRIHAVTDTRHRLRLGEYLSILADADFEILRPRTLRDQHLLQFQSLGRARLEAAQITTELLLHLGTDRFRLLRSTLGLLLDDAFQQRTGKRHTGGLDGLKIDRRQQPRLAAIATGLGRIREDVGQRSDALTAT